MFRFAIVGFLAFFAHSYLSAQIFELLIDVDTSGSSSPVHLTEYNGKVYFASRNAECGMELWVINDTAGAAHLVKDITYGAWGSWPYDFTILNGQLYFFIDDTYYQRYEFWATDGSSSGTRRIKTLYADLYAAPTFGWNVPPVLNDKIFFQGDDGVSGNELWVSDGTPSGTTLLMDINPNGSSYPASFCIFNNLLFSVLMMELMEDNYGYQTVLLGVRIFLAVTEQEAGLFIMI